MQNLKTYSEINERLGIPEGNIEIASDLYDFILDELSKISSKNIMSKTEDSPTGKKMGVHELKWGETRNFSGKKIKGADLIFNFIPWNQSKIGFIGMTLVTLYSLEMGKSSLPLKQEIGTPNIIIRIGVPENKVKKSILSRGLTFSDIINYIKEDRDEFASSLAHELKHAFDKTKRGESYLSSSKYSSFSEVRFGIPAIDKFLFNLYVSHHSEGLVRPSEFGSILKSSKTKKEEFLKTYQESDLVNKLKKARDWSFDQFKKDLLSQVDIIRKRMEKSGITPPEKDEEVVDEIISLLKINLQKKQYEELIDKYSTPYGQMGRLMAMFGGSAPWDSDVKKEMKKLGTEKDPEKYFRGLQKTMNRESDKSLRKIAKLYDYISDDVSPAVKENSSIVDMAAYQDFMGIKPLIKKFTDFKS